MEAIIFSWEEVDMGPGPGKARCLHRQKRKVTIEALGWARVAEVPRRSQAQATLDHGTKKELRT